MEDFTQRGGKRDGAGRKKIREDVKRNKQWRLNVNEKELELLNKKFDKLKKQELVKKLIGEEHMKVVAVLNQKGGIGKTTSVRNIGRILKEKGKKVLLIDMDQQGNLTSSFGIDKRVLEYTIHDLLSNAANKDFSLSLKDVIINVETLDLVPSNIKLARADYNFGNVRGREYLLKEVLKDVEFDYDYCLIDCPPNLGIITDNALTASNKVIVPMKAEKFALEGINDLLDTVEDIQKFYNNELEILGVFLNQLKPRTNLHDVLTDEIKEYFGDKLFQTAIRDSIKIAEASALNQSITEYAPKSTGAEDYISLVQEILERGKIVMNKDKLKGIQNPLLSRGSRVESPVVQQKSNEDNLKFIYKYGRTTNISENLVNYIDFEDKTFINRIYNNYDELYNDDLNDLIESIKEIGLLNTVYLLEKDEVDGKKFLIVSGLRRMLSIKKILEEQVEIREVNKIVIFQKDTPYELLNRMSIDENTKRKDLTLLELSYKLRKDAKENKKSIESLLEEHKLNRRKFFRITKVMDYPVELRDIVDEVGINKAETINKIFKYKKDYETYEDIVNACKSMSERDLDTYYKNISKKKKEIFEYKINSKNSELNIKIKRKVDEDLVRLVEEFKRRLEELK